MPAVIKIGFQHFVFKSEAAGINAVKALSSAVEVSEGYDTKNGGYIYFPRKEDGESRIEFKIVSAKQLRACDPRVEREEKAARAPKQLDWNGPVIFQGEGGGK